MLSAVMKFLKEFSSAKLEQSFTLKYSNNGDHSKHIDREHSLTSLLKNSLIKKIRYIFLIKQDFFESKPNKAGLFSSKKSRKILIQ